MNVTTCPSRIGDCRCGGAAPGHEYEGGAGLHRCVIPGCGAMWANGGPDGESPYVVTLPRAMATGRRLYPVP